MNILYKKAVKYIITPIFQNFIIQYMHFNEFRISYILFRISIAHIYKFSYYFLLIYISHRGRYNYLSLIM